MADPFDRYFRDYAAAFDAFDAERIAAFFHRPLLLVGPAGVVEIAETAIPAYTHGLLEHHRESGYARAEVRDIEARQPAPNLAIATVHWQVFREDDTKLWDWWNTYNLFEDAGGWKILVATTHAD